MKFELSNAYTETTNRTAMDNSLTIYIGLTQISLRRCKVTAKIFPTTLTSIFR